MNPVHGMVTYGQEEITFRILYVERKSLEIAVHHDCAVVVKAPVGTAFAEVEQRVRKRAGWIRRQLDYFRQFDPRTPARSYVGGETHLYLGRQYRLKIEGAETEGVKLVGRYFLIQARKGAPAERIKALLLGWYAEKAKSRYQESFDRCWPAFDKLLPAKPRLQVRRMRKRWGSLSRNGLLTLNTDLVRAPRECIDYVITHELCHLQCHDHGPNFYRLLEKVMPDWEKRKHKLELALV
jgi:predicted metal-dependent hydrolase